MKSHEQDRQSRCVSEGRWDGEQKPLVVLDASDVHRHQRQQPCVHTSKYPPGVTFVQQQMLEVKYSSSITKRNYSKIIWSRVGEGGASEEYWYFHWGM